MMVTIIMIAVVCVGWCCGMLQTWAEVLAFDSSSEFGATRVAAHCRIATCVGRQATSRWRVARQSFGCSISCCSSIQSTTHWARRIPLCYGRASENSRHGNTTGCQADVLHGRTATLRPTHGLSLRLYAPPTVCCCDACYALPTVCHLLNCPYLTCDHVCCQIFEKRALNSVVHMFVVKIVSKVL